MTTTTAPPLTADDLAELAEHVSYGCPATLERGAITYCARVELDEGHTVEDDGDWFGALAWGTRSDYSGRTARPSNMDGAAEILTRSGRDAYWWQPPDDARRDPELRARLRRQLAELLECGYLVLVLERCEGADAYGAPIVRAAASIGAVEGNASTEYLAELLADLADELEPATAWHASE